MVLTPHSHPPGNPPHRLIEAEVFDPMALSPAQHDTVLSRLYDVHQSIFSSVSKKEFTHYMDRPDAVRTRIQIYRNELGALVGYCTVHFFEIRLEGQIKGIIRTEAGLLPSYRGSSMTLWFGAKEAFRYKALHPLRTVVFFATLVHPSSYHMFSKYFWRCYPYPGRHIPERWNKLLLELIRWSGDEAVDPSDLMIRRVGWITRENEMDTAAWRESPYEDVKYYVSRNPGYVRGHGLAMIAPLSVANLVVTFVQYSWHLVLLLGRKWQRRVKL